MKFLRQDFKLLFNFRDNMIEEGKIRAPYLGKPFASSDSSPRKSLKSENR